MPQTRVFFHAHCPDGIAAAWAVWKKIPDAQFYMVGYDTEIKTDKLSGCDVWAVDFSFKPEVVAEIAKVATSITIIDHHPTVQEYLPDYHKIKNIPVNLHMDFTNTKSGAVLAWEYNFPTIPIPLLLKFVQDRDLWKWNLPDSKSVSAWLQSKPWDRPEQFESYVRMLVSDYYTCVEAGEALNRINAKYIEKILLNATEMSLDGHKAWAVQTPVLTSEVGHELLKSKNADLAVIWFEGKDKIHVSLRSTDKVDVSTIAKKHGGGGHKSASGFSMMLGDETWTPRKVISSMGFAGELLDFYTSNPVQQASALAMMQEYMRSCRANGSVGVPYGPPGSPTNP